MGSIWLTHFDAQKFDEKEFSRVLFEIDAEVEEMANYSCIKKFSAFPNEEEHLININIFLKIKMLEEKIHKDGKFYHFYLQFSKESELNVKKQTQGYKLSLLEILKINYQIDSFFLAKKGVIV